EVRSASASGDDDRRIARADEHRRDRLPEGLSDQRSDASAGAGRRGQGIVERGCVLADGQRQFPFRRALIPPAPTPFFAQTRTPARAEVKTSWPRSSESTSVPPTAASPSWK